MKTLIFTCYSAVILFGDLPTLDRIVKNIQPAYIVHNPSHHDEGNSVSVSFLISATNMDLKKAKELVSDDWVKKVIGVTQPGKTRGNFDYLGCTSQNLTP